jgi:citrate synthase
MKRDNFLTAAEAAKALDISLPTLYAYVSRGLIRSEPGSKSGKQRKYWREDVEELKRRKALRRSPAKAVEEALHWGAPVLESSLSLITGGRLFYRGYDALGLAEERTFEEVAVLLWTGSFPDPNSAPFYPAHISLWEWGDFLRQIPVETGGLERFQAVLAAASAQDAAAFDLTPASIAQAGARIITLLAAAATNSTSQPENSLAKFLQEHWVPGRTKAGRLIEAALILCADHELNISSFTARCAASAAATPYAAVIAGLSALSGWKHGGMVAKVEALFREVGDPGNASAALSSRLRRGERIPGFGHPLYPAGDPRGKRVLELTKREFPDSPAVNMAEAVVDQVGRLTGELPTIDLALANLSAALALPPGTATLLFALSRTAGWIAHAIEQVEQDRLIRPRARYIGPDPESMKAG